MIKILFLIHDLGQGGAEKVLVNLVNNMDQTKFDITVMSLFGGGVNEQFLNSNIRYKSIFPKMIPGNSKWLKLLSPQKLHKLFIKEKYDIEVSYLEGTSARIISGCPWNNTKLVSWIHVEQHNMKTLEYAFRNSREAMACYEKFDMSVGVSEFVKNDFCSILNYKQPCCVLYNTVESDQILSKAKESVTEITIKNEVALIAVGTLKKSKGYERLLSIIKRLRDEGYVLHLYILGRGPLQKDLEEYVVQNGLKNIVTFLGYQINPYKYVKSCDLFVCASYSEGFSTAATEALIVGTPVCTVEVSGMKEMLGDNNEYGIVTDNDEKALYRGIKSLLDDTELLQHYKRMAGERGKSFSTENTVRAVEEMLIELTRN